jgi:hypothetical protein
VIAVATQMTLGQGPCHRIQDQYVGTVYLGFFLEVSVHVNPQSALPGPILLQSCTNLRTVRTGRRDACIHKTNATFKISSSMNCLGHEGIFEGLLFDSNSCIQR